MNPYPEKLEKIKKKVFQKGRGERMRRGEDEKPHPLGRVSVLASFGDELDQGRGGEGKKKDWQW